MATKSTILNFPVPAVQPPALPVTFTDDTADGVTLTQSGDGVVITDTTPPPPPVVTAVVVSGPATLTENATAQFAAKVSGQGAFNPAVVWSCSAGKISSTGLFTAPAAVETVTITATSVQTPAVAGSLPVSISNPTNTVQFQASGGDDTAAFQAALNTTAAAKQILEMNIKGGVFHLNPITFPAGMQLLVDTGVSIEDTAVYSQFAVMFTIASANVSITCNGTAFVSMPINYANAQKEVAEGNDYEYQHAFSFQPGASSVTWSGISISNAAGDSLNFAGGANITVSNPTSNAPIRQGISITGPCSGITINNPNMMNGPDTGIDFEPDSAGQSVTDFVINNYLSSGNAGGAISFGFFNIGKTAQVSVVVNGINSQGDGGTAISFWNNLGAVGNAALGDASGSVTVNNFIINGCAYDGCYGRKANGGWTMIFRTGTISNTNVKGKDPHYGTQAAIGVGIDGGVPPGTQPGGVSWTGVTITESNSAVAATDFESTGAPKAVIVASSTFNGAPLSFSS
jgi:hypothetical protein